MYMRDDKENQQVQLGRIAAFAVITISLISLLFPLIAATVAAWNGLWLILICIGFGIYFTGFNTDNSRPTWHNWSYLIATGLGVGFAWGYDAKTISVLMFSPVIAATALRLWTESVRKKI